VKEQERTQEQTKICIATRLTALDANMDKLMTESLLPFLEASDRHTS
jgi:hypothetical protein